MKKESNINKEKLKSLIEKNYSFTLSSIKFIPKGADADAYIITTKDKKRFFIKLYDLKRIKRLNLRIHFESLPVLHLLHEKQNITKISYPILTKQQKLSFGFGNHRAVVFNYVPGKNDEKLLTKKQLENFAVLLAQIHKSPASLKKLITHKENFDLSYLKKLERVLKLVTKEAKTSFQKKISKIVSPNYSAVLDFIEQTRKINITLPAKDMVIVHSDPYFLNLMKTRDDVYLIDWDGIKLGPKEQDIWFYLIKGICNDPFMFLNKYKKVSGKFKLNKKIIHFYIQNRVLEDLYHFLQETLSGKEDKVYLKEIKGYCLNWILNIKKMFSDLDRIIDDWNKRN